MSATKLVTLGLASLALSAFATAADAGSWPPVSVKSAGQKSAPAKPAIAAPPTPAPVIVNGFEFVGGESGWEPARHRYVLSGGKLVHSEYCDHVIRTVTAPTPAEIESTRLLSPGG